LESKLILGRSVRFAEENMKPQTDLRPSRHEHHPSLYARHARLIPLIPLVALLLASQPKALNAQQPATPDPAAPSQNPQPPKPKPPAGHYAVASPQPETVQPPQQASVPAPPKTQQHQPAPIPDPTPEPKYAQQSHPVPAPDRASHTDYARQLNLAPAPQQAPDPGYIPHPYVALNQSPDPRYTQNPGSAQQTYPAPNQAPDPGYTQPSYPAPNQAPDPSYSQPGYSQPSYAQPSYAQPGYAQNDPGYGQNYSQPGPQPGYDQQDQGQQPMGPDQLEQLLAPIALYPDALVAQVLAAATYPAQVVGADHWLQSQGYASPDSIAYAAAQQSWDPSVKALTAFPQVLALMDHDIAWTTDLGNAYYNQPQDVMQTLQVLRQRALSAGTLQNTPQEAVTDNQGYLQLAPVNPQVVYVPAYNPWNAYGQPIQPYSGFSLLGSLASFAGSAALRFGPGIAMGAFNATPFGWATWALNWLGSAIFFNHSNYMTHSTTVAHWNQPRGVGPGRGRTPRPMDAYNRGGNNARPGEGYRSDNRPYSAYRGNEAPYRGNEFSNRGNEVPNRAYQQPGNYARPAQPGYAYNRPQAYDRPGGGYGSSYYGNPANGRPATEYSRQQALREPTPQFRQAPQYNSFNQRGSSEPNRAYSQPYSTPRAQAGPYSAPRTFSDPRSYSQPRNFAQAQPQRFSGGNSFYGGRDSGRSHESYREPKAPKYKAPKAPKEHGGGHTSGGSHHSGGHHF
jgi:hypothetical protein